MSYRDRTNNAQIVTALPSVVRFSQESNTLAEKLAKQVKWMQKKGIDMTLKEWERPRHAQRKSPLPGSVIYFSNS